MSEKPMTESEAVREALTPEQITMLRNLPTVFEDATFDPIDDLVVLGLAVNRMDEVSITNAGEALLATLDANLPEEGDGGVELAGEVYLGSLTEKKWSRVFSPLPDDFPTGPVKVRITPVKEESK